MKGYDYVTPAGAKFEQLHRGRFIPGGRSSVLNSSSSSQDEEKFNPTYVYAFHTHLESCRNYCDCRQDCCIVDQEQMSMKWACSELMKSFVVCLSWWVNCRVMWNNVHSLHAVFTCVLVCPVYIYIAFTVLALLKSCIICIIMWVNQCVWQQ